MSAPNGKGGTMNLSVADILLLIIAVCAVILVFQGTNSI